MSFNHTAFFFCVLALVLVSQQAAAYKIIMFPYGNKSHLIEFHGLGRVLLDRGHDVHIYLSKVDTPPSEVAKAGYKFIQVDTNETFMPIFFTEKQIIEQIDKSAVRQLIETRETTNKFLGKVKTIAQIMLNDKQTLEIMRREKYDFAIVDNIFFLYFIFLIPHKLGVPYGGLTTMHDPLTNRVPFIPSAFPDVGFSTAFGTQPGQLGSSIMHRFKNLFATVFHELYLRGWTEEAFIAENVTYEEIVSKVSLHLVDQHYLLTDPLPTTPNCHMVGGMVTRPAQAITDRRLLDFIEGTDHPVIVCSFGSIMSTLTPAIVDKLFTAFSQVPQYRFVMRLKMQNLPEVPSNLLILDWLPQNDLLGHNKTALLITHSGNNGQNEALYHGMPMVAFYIFGDQEYNADRIVRRGYGVKLNLLAFSEGDLVAAIKEVMENDSYRRKIKQASAIFRERHPGDVAADLVEHVIRFGSDHLRPIEAFEMSLIEYTMLDIVFVLITSTILIALLLLFAVYKLLKCIFS